MEFDNTFIKTENHEDNSHDNLPWQINAGYVPGKIETSAPGPNLLSNRDGLPSRKDLHVISGWGKSFKGSNLRKCVSLLDQYHKAMDEQVSITDLQPLDKAAGIYNDLLTACTTFVNGAQKGSSMFRKEERAMLPAMSTLLIRLYSLGNLYDKGKVLVYDYLAENQKTTERLGEVLTGRSAAGLMGNMSSEGMETGQVDRTALQMQKRGEGLQLNGITPVGHRVQKETKNTDFMEEMNQRRLPMAGDKNMIPHMQKIADMLSDIELQAHHGNDESMQWMEDIRVKYFDVSKMLNIILRNPTVITEQGAKSLAGMDGLSDHEKDDLLNAQLFFQQVQGKTVGEAVLLLDEIRRNKPLESSQKSKDKGGVASVVEIDLEKKRVLRTEKKKGGADVLRQKNNFNYDEAMSRLAEVTGLGSMAGARATYFKDKGGEMQYGTNMDLASGGEAKYTKLSFGSQQADSRMKAGRHNVFDSSSPEMLEKNAQIILSSYRLQILDYIGLHQDRHFSNVFVDLNNPENAFTGIDNDYTFGVGPGSHATLTGHATGAYEEKGDLKSSLEGFDFLPPETARAIAGLDVNKIEDAMVPYLDRAARFALVRRVQALKERAKNAEIIDIHTPDGMEQYRQKALTEMVKELAGGGMLGKRVSAVGRKNPVLLARVIAQQYFFRLYMFNENKNQDTAEEEYNIEGLSAEEFYKNSSKRDENYQNTFDALLKEIGMSRAEAFEQFYQRKSYETEQIYQINKDIFINKKRGMFVQ